MCAGIDPGMVSGVDAADVFLGHEDFRDLAVRVDEDDKRQPRLQPHTGVQLRINVGLAAGERSEKLHARLLAAVDAQFRSPMATQTAPLMASQTAPPGHR